MTWAYEQRTGHIIHNDLVVSTGYSGHGVGLDNPGLEAMVNIGPIPRGKWKIDRWEAVHADKGPVVAVLEPVGHDAHGRSGFLIHGDNSAASHTASHGCLIAPRSTRESWRASGEMELEVVA